MKVLIEIEEELITKDDISHEDVIDCIHYGTYYMMQVAGHYNIADSKISIKEI